ncbi:MAG: S41 family peptidase [Gemmataceae bacterium]|nr:S41 family peptidase [Gemmataceae bacterium]
MPRNPWCFAALVLVSLAAPAAAEQVRLGRTPDIAPDGRTIAFSYLGDIWLVDAAGGTARHLTMHERHEINPIFSPDGKQIAFSSNRHGSYDVFVIPVEGGRPTRLTHDSADDHPTDWSPDGQRILFASSRSADFPSRIEMYTVPVGGGMAERVSAYEGREGSYSPKGDLIAYVRGPGTWYRKGYRGSANDDIWLCNADGSNNRLITRFNGQDNAPLWSPDGRFLYYVSEQFATPANVVRQEFLADYSGPAAGAPEQVTLHKEDGVRRARLSRNGQWLVYECGAELWLHSVKDGKGRKLNIEVHADDKTNLDKVTTFTAKATEYALSFDEKNIAIVVHGEIFLMPRTGGKAKRLTDHPAFDHGVAWSPDSRKMLFLSDRGGHDNVWLLEADDPDHPDFVQAHRFKTRQLTKSMQSEMGLSFAPNGKRVTFLRAGRLISMNPDGSDERAVTTEGQVFDYDWSPDSQWICVAKSDASFASELYIIPATGATRANPARNITRFATYNGGVTWSRTNNRLGFISQRRRNLNSAFVLSLQKPAAANVPAGKDIDWDDIHLRVRQPSPMTIGECAISNDGTRIAFRANQDGDDLWVANVDGRQVTRITTGSAKPTQIQWSRFFGSQVYFRDGAGNIKTANVSGTPGANVAAIPFQARMVIEQHEVFQEMFEQSWRALSDNFYDPGFHGADWNKVRAKYRPLVQHCALKEDLYSLIYLMLGELNASHLGISGNLGGPEQTTAELGLLFDRSYQGPGLRIAEILKGGPADRRGLNIKAGDIVVAIDGTEITPRIDTAQLLNDRVGEMVAVHVTANPLDARAKRRVEIQGDARQSSTGAGIAPLMYERWAAANARRVSELSKGRLGYIHIPNMQQPGLDRFLRQLYSDNFDKDGLVLDVRYNGGGFTHESILNYLLGKEHTTFSQRNGAQGFVLNFGDRKWTRPLVCLVNNRSYSDAEIFPHAFRVHRLGKLVGQATGGHVIGTRNFTLIDGSQFRMPRIGVRTNKGVNMEKEGVVPDVVVDVHPDALARGDDAQLDKAVEVLALDVEIWRKTRGNLAGQRRPGAQDSSTVGPAPPMLPPED